jgi:hypothetical protein
MIVFDLTPAERAHAERRHREFVATSTEERYAEIVFERMLERRQLETMLAGIDFDLKQLYGIHPHQVARYGGVQSALEHIRPHHPEMQQFYLHWTYYMDALLLRERTTKSLRRVIALKRFALRAVQSFREHYYAPPWGRGARRALRRLKQAFKVRSEE